MRFYEITHSTNPQEVGTTHPQSQTSRDTISIDDPRHLRKQGIGYMQNVYIPQPVVHPDAKLSDLLSTLVTWRLVLSLKLKNILEKHTTPGQCQFLEMTVHYLSSEYKYWVLNVLRYNMELVDFPKSEVWLCGAGDTKIKQIHFDTLSSFEEYSSSLEYPERLIIYKVKLRNEIAVDFFKLSHVYGSGYYVSEKLKDEIIEEDCTGISFEEIN
jgi:hypothetical protein